MTIPPWKQKAIEWAKSQQGKHFCKCGCGTAIVVGWYHLQSGIPETVRGHWKRMIVSPVQEWINKNQGKHRCHCGCNEVIEIKIHHHTRGIPSFVNGHTSRVANPMSGRNGDLNPHYKGGKYTSSRGYVHVLIGTSNGKPVYKLEHRLVMEQFLCCELKDDEVVHHINGIKDDNRLENLELLSNSEHTSHHAQRGEVGFGLLQKNGVAWRKGKTR